MQRKTKTFRGHYDVSFRELDTSRTTLLFWAVTPCTLVGGYQRFGKHTVSVFRAEYEGQKNVILTAVRTSDLTQPVSGPRFEPGTCLLRILEVPVSNLGPETGYPD
jgi:hypothetical protein